MSKNFFLPKMSEREAVGKLIKTPGMVEAAATTPVKSVGVPRLKEKGFRTGLFDIVELRIANNPITQSVKKTVCLAFFTCKTVSRPPKFF